MPAPWDAPSYQRIDTASLSDDGRTLCVRFEDGARAEVTVETLLVPGMTPRGLRVEVRGRSELVLDEADGTQIEIPWTSIREASDPRFAAYLTEQDAAEQRRVGERLRALREHAKLTVADVAQCTGLNANDIFDYETAKQRPRLRELRALLAACGRDLRALVAPEGGVWAP